MAVGQARCSKTHPAFGASCIECGPHSTHQAAVDGQLQLWNDSPLAEHQDVRARNTDPASSHQAAARDFGIPGGVKGLARKILRVTGPDWMTYKDVAQAIFGPGPYTWDEAVATNKVSTILLKLYRQGMLERREDGVLRYRRL